MGPISRKATFSSCVCSRDIPSAILISDMIFVSRGRSVGSEAAM